MSAETRALWRIEIVDESWERFEAVLRLTYEVLYREFCVQLSDDWYHGGAPGVHAVALAGHGLAGAARLLGRPAEKSRQMRQVAVEPTLQGEGIGTALVRALEEHARNEGAEEIWLNARDTAYAFYERLGYEFDGEPFVSELTGIPHRRMRKGLS